MSGKTGEQHGMETAKDRGRGGGRQMNRDIVRRLVKRKQRRDGRLTENSVYVYIRGRQHRKTKQFNIKRSDRSGLIILVI